MLLSVSYYLLNIDVGSLFSEVLQRINFGVLLFSDHLLHYVEESDRWLGADSILEGAQQSIITKSFQFIFECSIIMSSYIALCLRQEQKVQCFYNIMVFAFFMCRLVHGYEILARMFGQLYIYWFIPFGYSLYIFQKSGCLTLKRVFRIDARMYNHCLFLFMSILGTFYLFKS